MKILILTTFLRKSLNCTRLDLFDNPTLAYENGDEITFFIYTSGGLSDTSVISLHMQADEKGVFKTGLEGFY